MPYFDRLWMCKDLYTTDFIFIKQKDMKYIRDSGVYKTQVNGDHRGIFITFNCNTIKKKDR